MTARMLVVLAMLVAPAAAMAEPIENPGAIESVTVYRGQALVTRVIQIDSAAGAVELVVTNLPSGVLGDSLFASGEDSLQIRAVRFRTRAVQEEPRKDVAEIEQAMQDLSKQIRKVQSDQQLVKHQEAVLDNLEKFSGDKAKDDLGKGTLNAESLQKMVEFIFKQRADLSAKGLDLSEQLATLQEKMGLLQRQRAELSAKFTRTAREAVVFMDKKNAGKSTLRLNYLVQGAGWSPLYNARTSADAKGVALEYNALIQQVSGEDWNNIKVVLSTASPNMVAEAPILTPLWVTLSPSAGAVGINFDQDGAKQTQRQVVQELNKAMDSRNAYNGDLKAKLGNDWAANTAADKLQIIDLVAQKDALLTGKELVSADMVLSVNYVLGGAISIPSRSDQQMIQIASMKIPAELYYQATPVLTPYVYQQADLVNNSAIALLSGPVNAYFDGQFMGRGQLPLVAAGQHFTVGFGVDSQLRVSRELVDKTEKPQGGNRQLTFKYRINLDNYKDKPVQVRLLDRLPDPKSNEITVAMLNTSQKVSEDKVYQQTLSKAGILRWDVDVPAKSSGASAKPVEYEYKLEFDKNLFLATPSPAQIESRKSEFLKVLEAAQ